MTDKEFVLSVYPDAQINSAYWGHYISTGNAWPNMKDLSYVYQTPERAWEGAKDRISNGMLKKLEQ